MPENLSYDRTLILDLTPIDILDTRPMAILRLRIPIRPRVRFRFLEVYLATPVLVANLHAGGGTTPDATGGPLRPFATDLGFGFDVVLFGQAVAVAADWSWSWSRRGIADFGFDSDLSGLKREDRVVQNSVQVPAQGGVQALGDLGGAIFVLLVPAAGSDGLVLDLEVPVQN